MSDISDALGPIMSLFEPNEKDEKKVPAPGVPAPEPSAPEPPPTVQAKPVGPPPPPPASPFGPIMDLAGKLRPTNPAEGARLDRYAQGISTRGMPGFTPALDIPMNLALATGYEGLKGQAMEGYKWDPATLASRAVLSKAGYDIKPPGSGAQTTSPADLSNIFALYRGLTGS